MNLLLVDMASINCKNLFNYAENNPVTSKDSSGAVVESAFDVITLAGSVVDVCCHPTDPWAWASLAGDAVDLIPVVTGVGEGIKGMRGAAKMAEKVDDVADAAKIAKKSGKDSSELKEIYNSAKESHNYPKGFKERTNGTTSNKVNNQQLLEKLRKVESGTWKKVYKDGYDANNNKISLHYFQSQSGKVFNVKVKTGWSN